MRSRERFTQDLGLGQHKLLISAGNEAVEGTPDCQSRRRRAIGSSRRVPRPGRRQPERGPAGLKRLRVYGGPLTNRRFLWWGWACGADDLHKGLHLPKPGLPRQGCLLRASLSLPWALTLLDAHPSTRPMRGARPDEPRGACIEHTPIGHAGRLFSSRLLRARKAPISDAATRAADVQQGNLGKPLDNEGWDGT